MVGLCCEFLSNGRLDRLKTRIVANGYIQTFVITLRPFGGTTSLYVVLLSMVVVKQWPLYELDINNVDL